MQPGKNKILIKPLPPETHTASGLAIPDSVQKNRILGTVIGVGDYDKSKYGTIEVGDTVSFGKYAGEPLFDLLVMHPGVLYSVVKDGQHQALGSFVIVELEQKYKKSETVGGVELILDVPLTEKDQDVFFNKGERLSYFGTVLSVPSIEPTDDSGRHIVPVVSKGEKVYFRFMNVSNETSYLEKSVSDFSEKFTIRVPYEDIFCTVSDGLIKAVGEWVLGESFIDGDGEMVDMPIGGGGVTTVKVQYHGTTNLVKSVNTQTSKKKAVVKYVSSLRDYSTSLKVNDIVFSSMGLNFENEIEGKKYYCFLESYQADAVVGHVGCERCKNNCPCKK